MKSDLIDLSVQKIRETEKAYLVTVDVPDNAVWVPKSQAELEESGTHGIYTLTIPEWLAIEKGFI